MSGDKKPKVFVFCSSCAPGWHYAVAIAEDGTCLADHLCSHHGYIAHDMGISEEGWKRDLYAAHYPDGFDVEWVPNPRSGQHAGLDAAYALNLLQKSDIEVAP